MQTIRATKKFLDYAGIKSNTLVPPGKNNGYVGPWYARIFTVVGKRCVLCTNADTRFSFVRFNVLKRDLKDTVEFFTEGLFQCVKLYDFAVPYTDKLLGSFSEIEYGKAEDRSVTGCMNLLEEHVSYRIWQAGGLENVSRSEINLKINEELFSSLGGKFPWELFELRLKNEYN